MSDNKNRQAVYRERYEIVKICNAEGTKDERQRVRNACKHKKFSQKDLVLYAVQIIESEQEQGV